MTFRFKALVAAAALGAIAFGAQAGPAAETIAVINPNQSWGFSGDEDAYFDFTIATPGTYELDISANASGKNNTIVGLSLWTGPGHTSFIDQVSGGSKSVNWVYDFVGPGTYSLFVDSSSSTAVYGGNIVATTAVPEPESYAMMLAGLGALGFMARRRKQG